MKYLNRISITALCAGALALGACHHDHTGHHEAEAAEEAHHHNANEIVVEPAVARDLGIAIDTVRYSTLAPTVKVAGIVENSATGLNTASAPVAGQLRLAKGLTVGQAVRAGQTIGHVNAQAISGGDANASARAALDAAEKELKRLEPLYKEGIVTARDYNAAMQAVAEARAQYSPRAAGGAVTATISGTIIEINATDGQIVDLGSPIATIAAQGGTATLRLDVPAAKAQLITDPRAGYIVVPTTGQQFALGDMAKSVTRSPQAQGGYVPLHIALAGATALMPGTTVDAYLPVAQGQQAITVPRTALLESQGTYYVYTKVSDHGYHKQMVMIGASDGPNVQVTSGLEPGQALVTKGAAAVKMAETSGKAPEGHHHH